MKEIISKANTNSVKRHDALYTTAYSETWPKGGRKKSKMLSVTAFPLHIFVLCTFVCLCLPHTHTTETGDGEPELS